MLYAKTVAGRQVVRELGEGKGRLRVEGFRNAEMLSLAGALADMSRAVRHLTHLFVQAPAAPGAGGDTLRGRQPWIGSFPNLEEKQQLPCQHPRLARNR